MQPNSPPIIHGHGYSSFTLSRRFSAVRRKAVHPRPPRSEHSFSDRDEFGVPVHVVPHFFTLLVDRIRNAVDDLVCLRRRKEEVGNGELLERLPGPPYLPPAKANEIIDRVSDAVNE